MKRPLVVTLTSVLLFLIGLAQLVFGIVIFANRNDASFLEDADVSASDAKTLGIVLIVSGAVSIVLSFALAHGSRIARLLVGIFLLAQIANGIYTLVKLDSSHRGSGIGTIVGSVIGLYLLFGTEKAKAFFAR